MSAEHNGAESSQMGKERLRVSWHWIVGISLVQVGQPHVTVLVVVGRVVLDKIQSVLLL